MKTMSIGSTRLTKTPHILAVYLCVTTALVALPSDEAVASGDRIDRILELEEYCESVGGLPYVPDESCVRKLHNHFETEPIWKTAKLVVDHGGKLRAHPQAFNLRSLELAYSPADLSIDEVPRWRDVFDGGIDDRLEVVRRVFDDEDCTKLEEEGPIDQSSALRCQAREMFKYATFLDACMTGLERIALLSMKYGEHRRPFYEVLREKVDPSLKVQEYDGSGWRLVETYLHTAWIVQQCSSMSSALIGDAVGRVDSLFERDSRRELVRELMPMHDAALAIAARAGDPWAIQSISAHGLYGDFEYWKSLREINPPLFHRWMAWLAFVSINEDSKAAALLALKAYTVEKQSSPMLELDKYLSNFGITRNDFGIPAGAVESLLEDTQWEDELIYPWDVWDFEGIPRRPTERRRE